MLVIDELKKNDPHLRLVALLLAGGLLVLLAGLWWVQVVSAREYQAHLDTQAYRTVRVPAVRGKILDREGRVLAENRPRYNLSLYLDELRKQFKLAEDEEHKQALAQQKLTLAAAATRLGRSLSKAERKKFAYTAEQIQFMNNRAHARVAADVVAQVSRNLGQPLTFDPVKFTRHYNEERAMPFPIKEDLNPEEIARFEENYTGGLGVGLEPQTMRSYPNGTLAAHLLGYVHRDDSSKEGEEARAFDYYLPDYLGQVGIEAGFEVPLRGSPGELSVLVNNMGYRYNHDPGDDVATKPRPGDNVILTLDLDLQRAAEKAIASHQGVDAHAAVVVMDVRNGDVLALASSPAFDPNQFAGGISKDEYARVQELTGERNRATQEKYAPGSIFKVVIGLAALENGLNPERTYTVEANPEDPAHGMYFGEGYKKKDTAPPGQYNFKRAIERSSNSYFIQIGQQTGAERIVALAAKFHFGQTEHLPTHQETAGDMPTLARISHDWYPADTANMSIGQGAVAVTPLQIATAYAAIANGGTVFWPRLVSRVEPQDVGDGEVATNFPAGVVRDHLGVSARSLDILRSAMLGETEDEEGTGKGARVPGLRICGKTGTAQVQDASNELIGHNYWFASLAPYESPRYAVVAMVQMPGKTPGSGGLICAPIAHDIYETIVNKENKRLAQPQVLGTVNAR
jgi:penicillin-binding protein 2